MLNLVIVIVAGHAPEVGTGKRIGSENVTATIGGAAEAVREIDEGVAGPGVVIVDGRGNVSAMTEAVAVRRIAQTENEKLASRTVVMITKVSSLLRALSNQ